MPQVSVLAKSVVYSLQISFFVTLLSTLKSRPPVFILGEKAHSDDITRKLESSMMTTDLVLDEANLFWAKKKGKKNDVLFRWGQVLYLLPYRFFLSSKRMPPQPFPTLYINSCSLSLHPPRIHKADTQKKKKSYHCAQAGSQFVKRCKCFSILLNYWNKPKIDVKRLEGDVTEKDNVLLSLCCSKNSMTNRTRRKEGFFIYRNISQIDFHLGFIRLFCLRCCLDLRLEGGGWD